MSFKDAITSQLENNRNSLGGLLSLSEYLKNQVSKFERISAGKLENNVDTITAISVNHEGMDVVAMFETQQLHNIMNGTIETISGTMDGENYIDFNADDVIESITNSVSQAQVQQCFIDTCLSTSDVSVESFITSVKARFEGVSSNILASYAEMFKTGDKFTALKSWISTIKIGQVVNQQDQYIEVVDRTNFTGVSVWNVVINDFVDTITGLFDKVWQGITDLKGFFERLWDGIVKLGKIIVSKAFRYLSSNLSAGGSKMGILDYPICSIKLGSILKQDGKWVAGSFNTDSVVTTAARRVKTQIEAGRLVVRTVNDGVNETLDAIVFSNDPAEYVARVCRTIISKCNIGKVIDPDTGLVTANYIFPCDVLLSFPDWVGINGLVLRYGMKENGDVYLQVYASMNQSVLDNYEDGEVLAMIHNGFENYITDVMMKEMHLPIYSIQNTHAAYENNLLDPVMLTNHIITGLESSETGPVPVDFASHFQFLYNTDIESSEWLDSNQRVKWGDGFVWLMIYGFLPLFTLLSPASDGAFVWEVNNVRNVSDPVIRSGFALDNYAWHSFPAANEDRFPADWSYGYKPYLTDNLVPASIHFQSLTERAREIEISIIAVIIAAAAIKLTVKLVKYRKSLAINTEIARGQCDNFAWTMDPTDASQISQYKSLRKKARKLERWGRLFGLTSQVAAAQASSSLLDTVGGISSSGSITTSNDVANAATRITELISG